MHCANLLLMFNQTISFQKQQIDPGYGQSGYCTA